MANKMVEMRCNEIRKKYKKRKKYGKMGKRQMSRFTLEFSDEDVKKCCRPFDHITVVSSKKLMTRQHHCSMQQKIQNTYLYSIHVSYL